MYTQFLSFVCCAVLASSAWAEAEELKIVENHEDQAQVNAHSNSMSIMVENGKIRATINGEEIPEDRIVNRDGRIVILDQDGNEIRDMQLFGNMRVPGAFQWGNPQGNPVDPSANQPRVMLGVNLDEPDDALCIHLGLEPGTTTMIGGYYEGLPADKAGLDQYDIITAINGKQPADPASFRKMLTQYEPGEQLKLSVIQQGQPLTVTLTLEAYDSQRMQSAQYFGETPELGGNQNGFGRMHDLFGGMNMPNWGNQFFIPRFDGNPAERFVLPDMRLNDLWQRLEENVRKPQQSHDDAEFHDHHDHEAIEKMNDRMVELEQKLERLLEQIEQSQSE